MTWIWILLAVFGLAAAGEGILMIFYSIYLGLKLLVSGTGHKEEEDDR